MLIYQMVTEKLWIQGIQATQKKRRSDHHKKEIAIMSHEELRLPADCTW